MPTSVSNHDIIQWNIAIRCYGGTGIYRVIKEKSKSKERDTYNTVAVDPEFLKTLQLDSWL